MDASGTAICGVDATSIQGDVLLPRVLLSRKTFNKMTDFKVPVAHQRLIAKPGKRLDLQQSLCLSEC